MIRFFVFFATGLSVVISAFFMPFGCNPQRNKSSAISVSSSATAEHSSTPQGMEKMRARVLTLALGTSYTCALLEGGHVRCWGANLDGQLGYGQKGNIYEGVPTKDVSVGGAVQQLAAGDSHTCALLEGGRVRCWGLKSMGKLGYKAQDPASNTVAPRTPLDAGDVLVGNPTAHIAVTFNHTCALLTNGRVRCWGLGEAGQLDYPGVGGKVTKDFKTPAELGDVPILKG